MQNPIHEVLAETKVRAYWAQYYEKAQFDFHWHTHAEVELTYIISGHGVRSIGSVVSEFGPGDLCLIPPHLPHAYGSLPGHAEGARWITLHFLPEKWGAAFWALPEMSRWADFLRKADAYWDITEAAVRESTRVWLETLCGDQSHNVAGMAKILAGLEVLLGRVEARRDIIGANRLRATERADDRLEKLLAWMQRHSDEPITLEQAARRASLSKAAFCRWFRQRVQLPFYQYLTEIRLARACWRLTTTDDPIAEIAARSGFQNLVVFNRKFRAVKQMTPRAYRAQKPQWSAVISQPEKI